MTFAGGPGDRYVSLMDQHMLLKILCDSEGYVACDGQDRRTVRKLEERGWAVWMGERWGSSFWTATDVGRAKRKEWETT